ncbi:MAG TPA: metalloregulator ArsR/SmtB family transcription factor [Candidatus Paceibacterota bacterium]
MNSIEKILKALANKRRLAIVKYLDSKKGASVGDIAEAIKLSFRSTSRHLRVLSSVDIIEGSQIGLTVIYKLTVPKNDFVSMVINKF